MEASAPLGIKNKKRTINRFSQEEDAKLKSLVKKFGTNNWYKIAYRMPGRNERQCKDRWTDYLSPNSNTTPWSIEEIQLLVRLHHEYCSNWKKIAKFFNKRPESQIRNKWKTISSRISEPGSQHVILEVESRRPQKEIKSQKKEETCQEKELISQELEVIGDPFTLVEFDFENDLMFENCFTSIF